MLTACLSMMLHLLLLLIRIVRLATQKTVLNSSSRFSGQSTAGEQPAAFFNYT